MSSAADAEGLTPQEREELNELAQWCHCRGIEGRHNAEGSIVKQRDFKLLAKALDELARLQVEVEVLRKSNSEYENLACWRHRPNTRT